MNSKKKILILPIEIKVREFLSKLYLAYNVLQKTDYQIIIGGNRFLTNNIIFKNCLWFDKNTFPFLRDKHPVHIDNKIIMLDEEGPISFHTKAETAERYSKKLVKQINTFIFSGQFDLKKLSKIFIYKNNLVIGNPKFDLLKKKEKIFFSKQVNLIKKKYKKFIFIPGHSVSFDDTNLYKNTSFNNFRVNNINKKNISNHINLILETRKIYQENYFKLLNLIKKIAFQNPEKILIFRHHPTEDRELIKNFFKDCPNNLKIVYKYSVTPWIIACDHYLHSGCQSVLEAAILKKKIISFFPNGKVSENFYNFSPIFNRDGDVLKFVGSYRFNLKTSYRYNNNNLYKISANIKKKSYFYKEFIKYIINKYSDNLNSEYYFKEVKKSFIYFFILKLKNLLSYFKNLNIIKKFIVYILPYKYFLSKESSIRKFNKLTKYEILSLVKVFDKIQKKRKKILIKKLSNSTFLLYKK